MLSRLLRLQDSPFLLGVLLVAILLVALPVRARLEAHLAPRTLPALPDLPGWRWEEHPNVTLIAYRPDCGCSLGFVRSVQAGLAGGTQVVVLTHLPTAETSDLKWLTREKPQALLRTHVSLETIKRLTPSQTTTAYAIARGRMRPVTQE